MTVGKNSPTFWDVSITSAKEAAHLFWEPLRHISIALARKETKESKATGTTPREKEFEQRWFETLDGYAHQRKSTFNSELVRREIADKVVLVTGAAGTIGSELCRQILAFRPRKLICVDRNETGLFYIDRELSLAESGTQIVNALSDISNADDMLRLFSAHDVETVVHSAALKHIPLLETHVYDAVRNNVFGLMTLLETAERRGCTKFLLISSDKAVNPASVMGCTMRICELIISAWPSARMKCLCVRFGNVLGSQGSVIPIFLRQIETERRVTITHPDVTRFFMTSSEAIHEVLQALAIGGDGDIFVIDMGQPIRIIDLARTIIRLIGKDETEVAIFFTGLRPGETLHQDLFYQHEQLLNTESKGLLRVRGQTLSWQILKGRLIELRESLSGSADSIRVKMRNIVPEFSFVGIGEPSAKECHIASGEGTPSISVDDLLVSFQAELSTHTIRRAARRNRRKV